MSQTITSPVENESSLRSARWMTVIFNNDVTPFDLVVITIMAATECGVEEAEIEAWEAHTYGKAPIHFSSEEECQIAASVMRSIGVKAEVCPEWND